MRACIVKIGNSQGIRLPKLLLDQTGMGKDVELEVSGNQIIIRGVSESRAGWDHAFSTIADTGRDTVIDEAESISNAWDHSEWEW